MLHRNHPFFLFLVPGLAWEKLEAWSEKKIEKNFQKAAESERITRVEVQQLEEYIISGENAQKTDIKFVTLTTTISVICILLFKISSNQPLSFVAIFGMIWVIGAIVASIISVIGWVTILNQHAILNMYREQLHIKKQQVEHTE